MRRKGRTVGFDGGRGAGRMRISDRMEEKGCWANATDEMEGGGKLVTRMLMSDEMMMGDTGVSSEP